jgi:YD repeat-containing protein
MPVYGFHLDVPAPPEVVEARVRAVVGRAPTFWGSLASSWRGPQQFGFPFVGTVGGRSFLIRRAIQYRNSFLPQIRGKIVATPTGSRTNVFMFMHPFSLIFMLVWFGFLISIESRLLNANIAQSYVPIGLIVFGLVLSLGGFFFEALKVMPLLSAALFNPAIVTVPEPAPESQSLATNSSPLAESSTGRIAVAVGAAAVLLAAFALVNRYEGRLRSCPAFGVALDLVSNSAAARAALGAPVKAGLAARGMVREDAESGYATMAIPVAGPRTKGTFYFVANRTAGRWDIERAALYVGSGSAPSGRIDLSPPPKREKIDYPAPGRVYLLPLDSAAASDLRELPAYYKALLDLDVTVLEPQELGADTVDGKAKQVIAEKALDSIEQAHPEIAEDLDSVIVAVTSQDLNILTSGWRFAAAYRHGRFGIFSTARLHGMPWYAGPNPEIYGVRVRKMVTKNLALLHYPVTLNSDATSALASWGLTFTAANVDEMGERFEGENGTARSISDEPCVTITQGPGGKQSWRVDCIDNPPAESRFETFETYPVIPLFVMSRTDFSFGGRKSFAFVREYRPQDDRSRAFGIGVGDSFDIYPVGDSQTFSEIDLILAAGGRIHYQRTSPGESYADAKLQASAYMGSPFSLSSLAWNGNGWDLTTLDGWTYRFPSSGPGRTWQQCALIGIRSASGQRYGVKRNATSDLREVTAPDGTSIEFTTDAAQRITSAKESSGRTIQYDYDAAGRLTHVHDSENGDESYEYDPTNRLISVFDAHRKPLLVNTYGYLGEIQSQTLADGRKLSYESGYSENRKLDYLKLTLPNGYTIEWWLTRYGFTRSWPQAPKQP